MIEAQSNHTENTLACMHVYTKMHTHKRTCIHTHARATHTQTNINKTRRRRQQQNHFDEQHANRNEWALRSSIGLKKFQCFADDRPISTESICIYLQNSWTAICRSDRIWRQGTSDKTIQNAICDSVRKSVWTHIALARQLQRCDYVCLYPSLSWQLACCSKIITNRVLCCVLCAAVPFRLCFDGYVCCLCHGLRLSWFCSSIRRKRCELKCENYVEFN